MVPGAQGFGRVTERRRQQVGEGVDQLVIQVGGKIEELPAFRARLVRIAIAHQMPVAASNRACRVFI